jgi:hypothetical protein
MGGERTFRAPLCKGRTCPARGEHAGPCSAGRGKASSSLFRRARGRYLTGPILGQAGGPAAGSGRRVLPLPRSPKPALPARPPAPRPHGTHRPRLQPPIVLHPPPPHCGARSTCPIPAPPLPRARPRAAPRRAALPDSATAASSFSGTRPEPAPRSRSRPELYLVGVGGQEDVELGFCRSIHLGPQWRGRAPRAPRRGCEEGEKWASPRSVA